MAKLDKADGSSSGNAEKWKQLMVLAQEGNGAAYENLLSDISKALRSFLSTRVSDESDREDIVQETLIAVHRARHTYNPERPFTSWMYTIAKYKMIDYFRKINRKQRMEKELMNEDNSFFFVPELPDESSAKDAVLKTLSELPVKQKQILELMKLQGLSVKEVSKITGMSESAVKVNAHRGYKILRKKFGVIK